MYKKTLLFIFSFIVSINSLQAFDLDATVDDDIRKNYNSSKLIRDTNQFSELEELPDLPTISKEDSNVLSKNEHVNSVVNKEILEPIIDDTSEINIQNVMKNGKIKISSGTSIDVVSLTKVSDWLGKGNSVKFVTKTPIIKRKYTIPAQTTFYGEVIESHRPWISCNGGLVVIRVRKMSYNGQVYPINAYITRANDKMIFLNNIKGDRTYLKTMWKKGNWGRTLFGKMMNITINLGGDGSTLLFSPFPVAYGTICLGLNAVTSPITAFFSKGGHVSIPVGSKFRIKLMDDVFVN